MPLGWMVRNLNFSPPSRPSTFFVNFVFRSLDRCFQIPQTYPKLFVSAIGGYREFRFVR